MKALAVVLIVYSCVLAIFIGINHEWIRKYRLLLSVTACLNRHLRGSGLNMEELTKYFVQQLSY